jgi:hypothetical protein
MDTISASKRYYLKNRERILEREKEKKRWLTYHETHRDEVNARRRNAYKAKKEAAAEAVPNPPASSPTPGPSSPTPA